MQTVINKFAIDQRIRVGYGTAFFLLLISFLLTLYANSELEQQARLVDRSSHIQAIEQSRLKIRLDEMTSRWHVFNAIVIISLTLAISLAAYGFFTNTRENKARRIADEKVAIYQQQLKQQITELDKANKALIQRRSIEKFAATGRVARAIAHEVRNPLTNINLAVDQLKSELSGNDPDNYGLILEMISRNSVRINQLISNLLNSTKFAELVYKRISINQLLDETLELANDRIAHGNITVVKYYSEGICDISVDVARIKIAFLNLVVNAIEAMEPGKGILQVRTESKDDKCVVTIIDNGPGIDPESQSKIFEPYFTTKTKGTGLGLTNTQNIILNHNGHISMESGRGKGTTFTIALDFA